MSRPSWDDYGQAFAEAAAIRGDCTRRKVGAAILDSNHRVIGAGYNGSYSGGPSCLKGECPRGRHYETVPSWAGNTACEYPSGVCDCNDLGTRECACGGPWPCSDAVPPGSSYDTGPGACVAVHAELNAILDVSDRNRLVGSTLYITAAPCDGCLKIIKNTGIARVVYLEEGERKWNSLVRS